MDYEKEYKAALERCREFYVKLGNKQLKEELEYVFPELAKSEDEKIRKEIIDFVKSRGGFKGDWIAWLEKQGEQKPTGWSEEDEKFFKTALWHISYSVSNGKRTDEHCDTTDWLKGVKERLKSLRPQSQWKPSKEQLHILESVIADYDNQGLSFTKDMLCDLFEDLKKLKE